MKRNLFLALAVGMLLASCSSENEEVRMNNEESVTIRFSPYEMEAMTRSTTSIADYVTHLDLWLSDGSQTTEVHQTSADAGFGTVAVTLDKTKTYTLTAVGHRGSDAATLSGSVLSFPDDKITQTFYFRESFAPSTTTTINAVMNRIVGMFRFETTDPVPENVKKMRFTLYNTFSQYNVGGYAITPTNRVSTVEITSTKEDGTIAISLYLLPANSTDITPVDIKVEGLNADNAVVDDRTFEDVPIKANVKTIYRGTYYITTPTSFSFLADDWQEFDAVTF